MRQPTKRHPDLRHFLRRRNVVTGLRSATPFGICGNTPGNTKIPAKPTSGCADPSGRQSSKSGAGWTPSARAKPNIPPFTPTTSPSPSLPAAFISAAQTRAGF